MGPKLSVNLNKVATLRNTRPLGIPSVTRCAHICLEAGAQGITLHPRPDERHIRPADVGEVAAVVAGYGGIELNLEGNPFHGLLEHARRVRPAQCTLVPDTEGQSTSDHGWDLGKDGARLGPIVRELHDLGCRVSLFMDADPGAMKAARAVGADRVELYTEPYASAFARAQVLPAVALLREAALAAQAEGLGVNAGHDLNQDNLPPLLAAVPGLLEVSIGHALIADAIEHGLAETVRRYLAIVSAG